MLHSAIAIEARGSTDVNTPASMPSSVCRKNVGARLKIIHALKDIAAVILRNVIIFCRSRDTAGGRASHIRGLVAARITFASVATAAY
jgi:hypothetical protein